MLSNEEKQELLIKIKIGDRDAREKLIEVDFIHFYFWTKNFTFLKKCDILKLKNNNIKCVGVLKWVILEWWWKEIKNEESWV